MHGLDLIHGVIRLELCGKKYGIEEVRLKGYL